MLVSGHDVVIDPDVLDAVGAGLISVADAVHASVAAAEVTAAPTVGSNAGFGSTSAAVTAWLGWRETVLAHGLELSRFGDDLTDVARQWRDTEVGIAGAFAPR